MIELRGLSKAYGSCVANRRIDLRVSRGSIHAIVGENGAGKSTAMKMLFGMIKPDSGEIWVDGKRRQWRSSADAIEAGLGMVHQHFMLAGPLTAWENVALASRAPWARLRAERVIEELEKLSQETGLHVPWRKRVEELPVGIEQRIEILKLLHRKASVLILDEPTAVLTPQETEELFARLRELASGGKTILIITHKLKEVMALSDEVTVFRAGEVVGTRKTSETSSEELASLMVGRSVSLGKSAPPASPQGGRKLLEVSQPGLEFDVQAGEIVGIAGVEGNGQSELLRSLMMPARSDSGFALRWFGQDAKGWSTARVRASGVAFVPEDRQSQGLLIQQDHYENYLLGKQRTPELSRHGWIRFGEVRRRVSELFEKFDVRPRRPDLAAGRLSGGNQQKFLIGRELSGTPQFLIAAQPTRGVDVGAIEFIHDRIVEARDRGMGVLLVSSELDEIRALADRILVMYRGKIVARFARGEADEAKLGLAMGGAG